MLVSRTFNNINISSGVTEFDLDRLAEHGERHYIYISFLDAAGDKVAANTLTGSVVVKLSKNGVDYGDMIDGSISLADTLTVPHAAGSYTKAKIDLSGITSSGLAESINVEVITYG
ncbi:hypothetical protein [Pseudoalteromonas sp.]|uniref:hypothetical protein n=1 Tax=Pseudoalteromonas sp. TaxID=53249 RepID=UPI003D112032